jgi:crotonobetainyl-CoA:carnitine CoA-transferase CaiB-like acyl-CoA transferase
MQTFLSGVRVLDLSRYLPGPYATHILCEMGAEVVKVEEPITGDPMRVLPPVVDGTSWAFQALNAGKKSVELDLKSPEAASQILRLAKSSHVFVETFRPGVAKRLGVDYEAVRAANPSIVYCSLTSYGQTGPMRDAPGHDINFVGLAGLLSLGPLPGITVADLAGGLMAATTIMGAIAGKRGVYIDLSLTDTMLSWLQLEAAHAFAGERDGGPMSGFLGGAAAWYRAYETKDGKRLSVGAIEPKFWADLCARLGKSELIDFQFDRDAQPRAAEAFASVFRTATLDEWMKRLDGLPVAPVLALADAVAHPQFTGRGLVEEFTAESTPLRRIAFPPRISPGPVGSAAVRRAPALGEHTRELLG